jgi:hypothetical protein
MDEFTKFIFRKILKMNNLLVLIGGGGNSTAKVENNWHFTGRSLKKGKKSIHFTLNFPPFFWPFKCFLWSVRISVQEGVST